MPQKKSQYQLRKERKQQRESEQSKVKPTADLNTMTELQTEILADLIDFAMLDFL